MFQMIFSFIIERKNIFSTEEQKRGSVEKIDIFGKILLLF